MIDNDEQVRRQKLRALKELRGQVGVGPEPGSDVPSEDITPRRERVREQLRHRRLAGGENTSQPGRGRLQRALTEGEGISGGDRPARGARLREALANRSRHGRAGVGADQSDEPAEPAGRGGRVGNRGMMRRRFSGARRNDGAGRSSHDAQALSELQTRVQQLTEEVERLRANQLELAALVNRMSNAGPADTRVIASNRKPTRRVPDKR